MGWGSYLSLTNASPYNWSNVYSHSYHMNNWEFPAVIVPEQMAPVYVEDTSHTDGAAEVTYSLADPAASQFEIQYRAEEENRYSVNLDHIRLAGAPSNIVPLGYSHDGFTPWILGGPGPDGSYWSSYYMSQSWMHDLLPQIGCRSLRELCIPASHDSGMSTLNGGTVVPSGTVITQRLNIYEQLQHGVRYFDIRPVMSGGIFKTGHYTGNKGANGEIIADVIDEINRFTAQNSELVILSLSHALDTDAEPNFTNMTNVQWSGLFQELSRLEHRFQLADKAQDLTSIPISTFVSNGAAVLVINQTIDIGALEGQGFFSRKQFPIFDEYANTDVGDRMINDQ